MDGNYHVYADSFPYSDRRYAVRSHHSQQFAALTEYTGSFRHYLICLILLRVYQFPSDHPRSLQSLAAMRELLIENVCLTGVTTGLLQIHILVACLSTGEDCEVLLHIFEMMRYV